MDLKDESPDDLSARIEKAGQGAKPNQEPDTRRNAGFDFVGSVLGGGVIGALLDHLCGTSPWCLLGGGFLGFIGGMLSAWRAMQDK